MDQILYFYPFICFYAIIFLRANKELIHIQGNPLSSLMFIVIMGTLNRMSLRARDFGMFKGLKVGDGGRVEEVIHLFFADDILLFCEPSERTLLNFKCTLLSFQTVFGIHIKLAKYDLVRIKYLGLLLGAKYKEVSTWW